MPYNCAGKIYIPPLESNIPQFWCNIGSDIFASYTIPPYVPMMEGICSKSAYDNLMADIDELFKSHSQGCCCTSIYVKRRPKFEAVLGRILKEHQDFVHKGTQMWPAKSLKWAYGYSLQISPHRAYDHTGEILVATVDSQGFQELRAAWPPPYYSIVISIPLDKYPAVRTRWPTHGGSAVAPLTRLSISNLENDPNFLKALSHANKKQSKKKKKISAPTSRDTAATTSSGVTTHKSLSRASTAQSVESSPHVSPRHSSATATSDASLSSTNRSTDSTSASADTGHHSRKDKSRSRPCSPKKKHKNLTSPNNRAPSQTRSLPPSPSQSLRDISIAVEGEIPHVADDDPRDNRLLAASPVSSSEPSPPPIRRPSFRGLGGSFKGSSRSIRDDHNEETTNKIKSSGLLSFMPNARSVKEMNTDSSNHADTEFKDYFDFEDAFGATT